MHGSHTKILARGVLRQRDASKFNIFENEGRAA